ncbi:MFS transporter [Paenibacillus sp. MBLB2552]|uniref:MFS transporter n=1 Tax=Paenibacillus mellifer TaxID=2937794 RepID=A0A9X1Y3C5_9BACL|nr:MFS transporter [Paenibacillus mellifer]MCK8489793.1 MFS transporter [Paenibacillus mellifer]
MFKKQAATIFYLMNFITSLAGSTIFTTYSIYYVTQLGLSPLELVLVGTVLELTVLIFEGITGVIADTYSRKLSVIIGMFVLGVGFIFEGSIIWLQDFGLMIPVVVWVMFAQVFFGLGHTFVSGADSAWMVDEVGESTAGSVFLRAKRVALTASLLGIGISVGLSLVSPNLPYLAGGLMYVVLGFLLIRVMKETRFVRSRSQERTSHLQEMSRTWKSGARVIARSPLLITIVFVTLFSGAASEGYDRLWEIHLIQEIGFPKGMVTMAVWFGLISAVSILLGMLAVRFTEKKLDMSRDRTVSAVMFVLTLVRIFGILSLALATNFAWALASVLVVSVVVTVSEPIYSTWLNMKLRSDNRATVLSMISQSDALGQTAGGPAVGWIGSRFRVRASLLAAAVLLVPILSVFGRILRKVNCGKDREIGE